MTTALQTIKKKRGNPTWIKGQVAPCAKPIKKGEVRNPNGFSNKLRLMKHIYTEVLSEPLDIDHNPLLSLSVKKQLRALQAQYPDKKLTMQDALLKLSALRAMNGNSFDFNTIAERTEGKVKDVLQVDGGEIIIDIEEADGTTSS